MPRKGNWHLLPFHFKLECPQGCLKLSHSALELGGKCRL